MGKRICLALAALWVAVIASPQVVSAHGDGFGRACRYWAGSGPNRLDGSNRIYAYGRTDCDYQHEWTRVITQLLYSPSGKKGTFRVIRQRVDDDHNTDLVETPRGQPSKNVCRTRKGSGFFKSRTFGNVFNEDEEMVHRGEDVTKKQFFGCSV